MPAKRIMTSFAIALVVIGVGPVTHLGASPSDYVCGDANGDLLVNVGDAVSTINYIFRGGPAPEPIASADANGDDQVNVGDAIWIVNYVFKGGLAPQCDNPPVGRIIGHSDCKSTLKGAMADSMPLNLDCLAYQYDGASLLDLQHINAAFNCCPRITADIVIDSGLITITESDPLQACRCICLFDVGYRIVGLSPGVYTIKIIGMFICGPGPLEFTVDLTSPGTDTLCVDRSCGTWNP